MSVEERFNKVYRKHVSRYQHKDTMQMCCMWPISNPPDEIFESDQIYDLESEFNIELTETEALEIYDMSYDQAEIYFRKRISEV